MAWQYHPKIECDYFIEKRGTWADISSIISRVPPRFASKAEIPLWSFYTVRKGPDAELARDKRHLHACSGNMVDVCALQVDYDDGTVSMADFALTHEKMCYGAYTSPGHKDSHPKFRVVIPLAKPLPNAYLTIGAVRRYLLDMFPWCDQTTINSFRKQRMPAQPIGGDAYRAIIGTGPRLELDMAHIAELATRKQPERTRVEIDEDVDLFGLPLNAADMLQEQKRLRVKYAAELADLAKLGRGGGQVHYALTRIAAGLFHAGLDEDRIAEFFAENDWLTKETSDISRWTRRLDDTGSIH